MTKGGSGSHWEGCEESHHDCAIAKLRAAEKRVKELEFVSYTYTCRDGHEETETFETKDVGGAYAEMRFRAEKAEYLAAQLGNALEGEIEALELVINPPPPPPDAVHASSFGSAGAGIVEDAWEKWAKRRLEALKAVQG